MTSTTTPRTTRVRAVPKSTSRSLVLTSGNTTAKHNGSILNFFRKAEISPAGEGSPKDDYESLFLEDETPAEKVDEPIQTPTPPRDYSSIKTSLDSSLSLPDELYSSRFNEEDGPSKRRRVEDQPVSSLITKAIQMGMQEGQYDEDSYDDEELLKVLLRSTKGHVSSKNKRSRNSGLEFRTMEEWQAEDSADPPPVPSLRPEPTSIAENEFESVEDFIEDDDEFPEEGEEYLERKWMMEERQFEMDSDELVEVDNDQKMKGQGDGGQRETLQGQEEALSCPICSTSFVGFTDQGASIHVNDCLDGKSALPSNPKEFLHPGSMQPSNKIESTAPFHAPFQKRFQRASIAKPGQENPFVIESNSKHRSSAFSLLMSSNAEDNAWAAAAAAETASRGKPAYQRTCPFYKILPGFSICVDAFRYGAVEGCKAYFLSHFHSDHYIGLTSSWCHGPIYCSHVTANLVRRQLRVDPKWVVELKFDSSKVEVPETGGVEVTMIPANHCPGSSLYLFEKVVGRGKTPKVQRVLHCGDFRACPAHVQHPLLRPEILDAVTGKNLGQQKLDVCYLDTTYLTPKYAFPSQEEVIKACADMCVSLGKECIDENDGWEKTKKERAGSAMVKFIQKETKEGECDSQTTADKKPRGRLLVIVGTYSIGKERICLGVARALNSKIYAPPNKQKICAALEDPELNARLTSNPLEAQVHMQMLMEIRAETLADYLAGYNPHFSRIVGFRPSGWNYRPPNSRGSAGDPNVHAVLHSESWKSRYSMRELVPQRGSTREAQCFGVPYSEHSSFRELTLFCCALRIDRIIPTVNVGSAKSREKMKAWCEKWAAEKKKNGLYRVEDGTVGW